MMLNELNAHRKEGHGGYYHKSLLIDHYNEHTDGENDATLKMQYDRVYESAVADGLIKIAPDSNQRCAITRDGIEICSYRTGV